MFYGSRAGEGGKLSNSFPGGSNFALRKFNCQLLWVIKELLIFKGGPDPLSPTGSADALDVKFE